MPGRTVLQWDKDDCAAIGLVKFDLLGLGMLDALHRAVDQVAQFHATTIDLGALAQEDAVYDLLCEADTWGSSRSNRAPRWRRCRACSRAASMTW